MQLATALKPQRTYKQFQILEDCTIINKTKSLYHWAIEQLQVEPFQHILEIGYGNGDSLHEIAKKTSAGFIAGTEASIKGYHSAHKKNKQFIENERMQLHIGGIGSLPYTHHYFHSIYSINRYQNFKDPAMLFMQLNALLKNGGRLITLFQPALILSESELWNEAEKIQSEYKEAGFVGTRISFKEMNSSTAIAAVGFKE
jgi:cyclopropane fatty-acyl-phospholipid synthase-like methyltransferase